MHTEEAGEPQQCKSRRAEDFLPPSGSIKEQVELQFAFLTQGVMDSMVASQGLFRGKPDEPEPYVAPAYYTPQMRGANANANPNPHQVEQAARPADVNDAARLAGASARLIGALARLRTEFRQHYTVNHVKTVTDEKDGKRRSRRTSVTGVVRIPETDARGAAPDRDAAAQTEAPANDDVRETPAQTHEDIATPMQAGESNATTAQAAEADIAPVPADALAIGESDGPPPPAES
jgi:hypothetical protein